MEWDTVTSDRKPITELPNVYKSVLREKKKSEKCWKKHFQSRKPQNWVKQPSGVNRHEIVAEGRGWLLQ